MKICVLYETKDQPTGGGNQFIKALSQEFKKNDLLVNAHNSPDIFLFNSHHFLDEVSKARQSNPNSIFVHRIDGPMRAYNSPTDQRDPVTYKANEAFADATVFQSQWSRQHNFSFGMPQPAHDRIIMNAPDPILFYPKPQALSSCQAPIRLIATAWSTGANKGFSDYQWMDEHLDWDRYQMTFIGQSPVKFTHIKMIPPMTSPQIAEQLRQHDIYISSSRLEACSNSLLEALHCGLPVLTTDQSSNPEIVQKAGLCYDTVECIPNQLDQLALNPQAFQREMNLPTIEGIASQYIQFFEELSELSRSNKLKIKQTHCWTKIRYRWATLRWKINMKWGI